MRVEQPGFVLSVSDMWINMSIIFFTEFRTGIDTKIFVFCMARRQLTELGSVVRGFLPGFFGIFSPLSRLLGLIACSASSSERLRFSWRSGDAGLSDFEDGAVPGRSPIIWPSRTLESKALASKS